MIAAVSLLVIVLLSLIVTRVATVALSLTGLSREVARFQARSAFSGAGFTTSESERVMAHPTRRRIIMGLILLGNAGIVTGVATLLFSFSGVDGTAVGARRALVVVGGLGLVWYVARSQRADRWLSKVIERALRRFTTLSVRDYSALLRLAQGWTVAELRICEGDWVAEHTLAELDLPHEGVLVLGIVRADGSYVGAPKSTTELHAGDVVLAYGPDEVVDDLDKRPADRRGDRARRQAERAYAERLAEQEATEQEATEHASEDVGDPGARFNASK